MIATYEINFKDSVPNLAFFCFQIYVADQCGSWTIYVDSCAEQQSSYVSRIFVFTDSFMVWERMALWSIKITDTVFTDHNSQRYQISPGKQQL